MAKVKGEELTPVRATRKQTTIIQELLDINETLKQGYERRDELMAKLSQLQEPATPIAAEVEYVNDDGQVDTKWMTFALGKPTGHYVVYRELDFILKAATTKKDKEDLNIQD